MKPAIHGRDHRPGRSDPIPGIIVFDFLNTGGWLSIDAAEFITLLAQEDIRLVVDGTGDIVLDTTDGDDILLEAGDDIVATVTGAGGTITLNNGTSLFLVAQGAAYSQGRSLDHRILAPIGGETIPGFSVTGTTLGALWVQISSVGQHTHKLGSGKTLTVLNSSGNPIMRLDESTGNLHLKAGASILMDL